MLFVFLEQFNTRQSEPRPYMLSFGQKCVPLYPTQAGYLIRLDSYQTEASSMAIAGG
jgi:hypothetical protein